MSDARPIGAFDSGVGGLSVMREVCRMLPNEDVMYFADTAHCPYGPRPAEEVRRLAHAISRFLVSHGAKLIVVACNTASVAAIASLRAEFPVPFVGIVPAVKPAAAATRRRRIGVLATRGTLEGKVFSELVDRFAADTEVLRQPCPGLVELVERGEVDGPEAESLVGSFVRPLLEAEVDTLVLGCTHYPFLRPLVERLVGPEIAVIDTGNPVARQVRRVLEIHDLRSGREEAGRLSLFTSGDVGQLRTVASRLLGEADLPAQPVRLHVSGVSRVNNRRSGTRSADADRNPSRPLCLDS